MRERDVDRKMFHKGHYEVIAKRFREALTPYIYVGAPDEPQYPGDTEFYQQMGARNALVSLAMDFTIRLQADSQDFDAAIFLNRCSPDPENFPLAELWEEWLKNNEQQEMTPDD